MAKKQTTTSTEHQPRIIAFVSGGPVEQENQTSIIKQFCEKSGFPSDIIFWSDWYKMKKDLRRGDIIIIADLTILSGHHEELAARLFTLLKNGIHVEPANKEHFELLRWNERCKMVLTEERTLAGLDELAESLSN